MLMWVAQPQRTARATHLLPLIDAIPMTVLALAPAAYGSVDLLFIASWCLLLSLALVLRTFRRSAGQAAVYAPAMMAVATVLVVALMQALLPAPTRDGWRAARDLLGLEGASWSTTRSGPWVAPGGLLASAMMFQWSFEFARRKENARRLVLAVIASSTALAIGAIALRVGASGLDLGRSSPAYAHVLTGPFVNRNTAADYWGSSALIAWLWTLRDLERCRARDPSLGGAYAFLSSRGPMAMGAAFLICLTATALTASRAVAGITAALLVLTLGLRRYQKGGRGGAILLAGALAFIVVVGLAEVGGGLIAQRVYVHGLGDPFRLEAYRTTVAMIASHPWFGVGFGDFAAAFPAFRSAGLGSYGVWEHAHSIPLELAAELGLPAATIVAAAWGAGGLRLLRGSLSRTGWGFFPLAGLSVGLLGTLHAVVDFALLIPGYAMVFAALTGCGLAQSVRAEEERRAATQADGPVRAAAPARAARVMVATPLGRGGRGGIDQIMDEVRRELSRAAPPGLRVRFVTTRGQRHLAFSPLFLAAALARLALAKVTGTVDVLHVNLSSHGSNTRKVLLCRAARLLRVPYVLHLHGSRYRQFYAGLDGRAKTDTVAMFRGAARVIVLGEVWKRFLVDAGAVADGRFTVLRNASRAPRRGRAPAGGDVLILFLGRVGERKGVPILLRALESMGREPGWRAIIAGDGEITAMAAAAAAAGLADRVELTGWVDRAEAERLLARADVLVLPSFDENLPMSVIEGMANGLAVVATPVGAVSEIIDDGRDGLLVPVGDADRLRDALSRLVGDPGLRRSLGQAARAYHRDHLEITGYVGRLASVWRQVARETSAAASPDAACG